MDIDSADAVDPAVDYDPNTRYKFRQLMLSIANENRTEDARFFIAILTCVDQLKLSEKPKSKEIGEIIEKTINEILGEAAKE